MARRAVRIAERQRQAMLPRTSEAPAQPRSFRPRYADGRGHRSAIVPTIGRRSQLVGTVRCAVRCPAHSRPPPDSRPNRWPLGGLRQR
jgi:hypothetical protein